MKTSTHTALIGASLLVLLTHLLPAPARAALTCAANPSIASLTVAIPATPINTVGSPISRYLTGWFSSPASSYTRIYDNCTTANTGNISLQGRVTLVPTGRSIDGFPIYATGVPGVGIIVQGRNRDYSSGVANPGAPALGPGWTTIVAGWSTYWDSSFGARLVSSGDTAIRTGPVTLGKIGEIMLVENGVTNAIVPVDLVVGGTLNITSKTCDVSAGSKNIFVPMGTINTNAFAGVGSTAGSGAFVVQLDNCSSGLNVYMTVTDSSNPSNTSDVLGLTPGAQAATGIGIRIARQDNSQRVSYGPESSLRGNQGQLSVGTATGATINLAFNATYVQTLSAIIGGTANAIATFTMSYQ